MTFLELVNNVLNRLREDNVTSVTQDPYVRNIASQVNDAKRLVEQAWKWSVMRDSIAVVTADQDDTVTITESANPDFVIEHVWNASFRNGIIQPRNLNWKRTHVDPLDTPTVGRIGNYWFESKSKTTKEQTYGIYPISEGIQTLTFDTTYSQPELDNVGDILWVPSLPVILLATGNSARERGEVGGTTAAEWMISAQAALADAIAYDSTSHPEELDWDAGYHWTENS